MSNFYEGTNKLTLAVRPSVNRLQPLNLTSLDSPAEWNDAIVESGL